MTPKQYSEILADLHKAGVSARILGDVSLKLLESVNILKIHDKAKPIPCDQTENCHLGNHENCYGMLYSSSTGSCGCQCHKFSKSNSRPLSALCVGENECEGKVDQGCDGRVRVGDDGIICRCTCSCHQKSDHTMYKSCLDDQHVACPGKILGELSCTCSCHESSKDEKKHKIPLKVVKGISKHCYESDHTTCDHHLDYKTFTFECLCDCHQTIQGTSVVEKGIKGTMESYPCKSKQHTDCDGMIVNNKNSHISCSCKCHTSGLSQVSHISSLCAENHHEGCTAAIGHKGNDYDCECHCHTDTKRKKAICITGSCAISEHDQCQVTINYGGTDRDCECECHNEQPMSKRKSMSCADNRHVKCQGTYKHGEKKYECNCACHEDPGDDTEDDSDKCAEKKHDKRDTDKLSVHCIVNNHDKCWGHGPNCECQCHRGVGDDPDYCRPDEQDVVKDGPPCDKHKTDKKKGWAVNCRNGDHNTCTYDMDDVCACPCHDKTSPEPTMMTLTNCKENHHAECSGIVESDNKHEGDLICDCTCHKDPGDDTEDNPEDDSDETHICSRTVVEDHSCDRHKADKALEPQRKNLSYCKEGKHEQCPGTIKTNDKEGDLECICVCHVKTEVIPNV